MSESQPQEERRETDITETREQRIMILECREQSYQRDNDGLACQRCWERGVINLEVTILCFECEKYLCAECGESYAGDHGEHLRTGAVYNCNAPDDTRQDQLRNIYELLENRATESSFLEEQSDFSELPINVKMTDEEDCTITGITILPNRQLAVIDNKNMSLKVIDMSKNKIKLFKFSDAPFDVAHVTEDSVAVIFQDKQLIMIVDINGDQNQHTTNVSVNDRCTGIHSHDGKVFAIGKKEMYIIQRSGVLELRVDLNQLDFHKSEKCYIAVRSTDDIFIVGNAFGCIYRIAIESGEINPKNTYAVEPKHFSGLCITNGPSLLLSTNNGILELDLDSGNTTPLSDVRRPQALAESQGIVFVSHKAGSNHRNFITSFQM